MSQRVQKEKTRVECEDVTEKDVTPADSTRGLKADLDALLDEVDSVLEKNAEEFVNAYVQKGGE